ncbi:MAG TPA: sulfatase-like hydrolase/transferase [Kofleriaceae bacterium]|nr:sulfatase-like hydrolase/transferase [Kofleriaceae bacterium]
MTWTRALPARWGWVRLLASPSGYLLTVAFVVTALAKLRVLGELEGVGARPLWWLASLGGDAALYGGLAALFALGERRVPRLMVVTVLLSALVAAVAIINGAYLGMTGEQITWQVMSVGLDRFGDVRGIVGEEMARLGWRAIVTLVLVLAVPGGAVALLRKKGLGASPVSGAGARAHAAAAVAVVGLLVALLAPAPRDFALSRLTGNAVLRTYWGWITDDPEAREADVVFAGYDPPYLVAREELARIAAGPRSNVVIVVMESTRRDVTSLAGAPSPAATPNLQAMARAGLEMTNARAVIPHTSKSIFSILCGRPPFMQNALLELSDVTVVQCLPSVLRAAGWRTGFFQSSVGGFEDRPRMARKLGFERFAAWEDIQGEPIGYLASDDESLAAPLDAFIAEAADRPFLAVLLTSGPHHPYRLSTRAKERSEESGAPWRTPRESYLRLVEAEDALVGAIHEVLAARGVAERTIVVVMGDHGEGFGEKGTRQHDNNFYEEGLHVPWVMTGPGVPRRAITTDVSLVDVSPTVLGLLGGRVAPETAAVTPARDLLSTPAAELEARPAVFSCWFDARCRGFVNRGRKVVFVPEASRAFLYDLAGDPEERDPRGLDDELRALLLQSHVIIDAHRSADWPDERAAMDEYPPWHCAPGGRCVHPKSPPGVLFGNE